MTVVNGLQQTTLAFTWSDGQSYRLNPINRLLPSCPGTYIIFFPERIFSSVYAENFPTLYPVGARRLRVNCVKRKRPLTTVGLQRNKNTNLPKAISLTLNMSIWVMYPRFSQGEWVSLLGLFPTRVGLCPVDWGCRTLTAPLQRGKTPPNECPGYGTKQSDGEAPAMLELWGMRSTPSLPSLPVLLWPGVVAPDRALSMG